MIMLLNTLAWGRNGHSLMLFPPFLIILAQKMEDSRSYRNYASLQHIRLYPPTMP